MNKRHSQCFHEVIINVGFDSKEVHANKRVLSGQNRTDYNNTPGNMFMLYMIRQHTYPH